MIGKRNGFTLVELMIVVAIIGILAAIAIPNFMQFRLKAKTAEVRSIIGAIRTSEVSYFAENSFYIGDQLPTPILDRSHQPNKAAWLANTRFSILGFAPEGGVFYSYGIRTTGDVLFSSPANGFTVYGQADLDDDGQLAEYLVNDSTKEIVKAASQPGNF
jgi:type IV pilus assembly protein PilA